MKWGIKRGPLGYLKEFFVGLLGGGGTLKVCEDTVPTPPAGAPLLDIGIRDPISRQMS